MLTKPIYVNPYEVHDYVKPYEVHDKLAELGNLNSFYDCILRHATIKENWDTDSLWVLGTFQSSVRQIAIWASKSRSYTRILLNSLTKAEIIVMGDDGSYELPMYKEKADEGITAADIQFLSKKVEDLEAIVREFL